MKNRTFGVVGLGNFGSTVALELLRFGNTVIAIDSCPKVVSTYADRFDQIMIVDSRDEDALREAGMGACDVALIAMGENLEASVLSAINLRMIGVREIWAKATSRTHHRILTKLGVDRIIHPEEEMGRHTAQILNNPLVHDYMSLGNGYHVATFSVPENLEGKTIGQMKFDSRFDLRCLGVMRGTDFSQLEKTTDSFRKEDRVMLLGKRTDLLAFANSI